MSMRSLLIALALLPVGVLAQSPATKPAAEPPPINAVTRAVLLVNRPAQCTEAQWLDMMEKPVHRSLYPLRVSQAMLDTLDARALDIRFQYVLVPDDAMHRDAQRRY